tara:strand:+ start:2126 stop:5404 length:3279 start_codon:yes stop_codon:yes gene_type:complete
MSNDFDPLKDYAYGDLNPLEPNASERYQPGNTSAIGALKEVSTKQYESNTLLGTGPYKAICLRIESAAFGGETQGGEMSQTSWLDRIYSRQDLPVPDMFIEIKAFIPEIHGTIYPTPKSLGQNGEADHDAINKFPTFTAKSRDVILHGVPKPGDIVWVDFGNRTTLKDPIYLGPLESQMLETIMTIAASDAFPCNDGLNMNPAKGGGIAPPVGTKESTESVGKIGPTMAPTYKPISIQEAKGKIPQGKGVFFGNDAEGLDLLSWAPVETAKKAGLSWVAIRAVLVKRDGKLMITDRDKLKSIIDAYHKNGIRCYIWGWPALKTPDRAGNGFDIFKFQSTSKRKADPEDVFIKEIIKSALECGAIGIIADPETDTYVQSTTDTDFPNSKGEGPTKQGIRRAKYLANNLSAECKKYGLSLGCTSVPIIRSMNPIHPWAKVSDFAIPQTYSASKFNNTQEHWVNGYETYKKIGFKNIMAGMGAYNVGAKGTTKYAKSANRMRWELHAAYGNIKDGKKIPWTNAIVWWEWNKLKHHDRWSVVRELGAGEVVDEAKPDAVEQTVSPAVVDSEGNSGEGTSVTVAGVGPTLSDTPKTKEKETSSEVVEKSKPEDKKIISDKKAELLERASKGPDGKARNFEEVPLTNEEIMKLSIPPLSKEQFEKLRNAADGKASVAGVGVLEKEQFEKIKTDIRTRLKQWATKGDSEKEIALLEEKLLSLKKKKKFFDGAVKNSLTEDAKLQNTRVLAKVNNDIKLTEEKIKELSESVKEAKQANSPTPSQTVNCQPPPIGAGGAASAAAGVNPYTKVPLAAFPKSSFPGATNDKLAIAVPADFMPDRLNQKFKEGVTQVMIHQSGNHTVKGTMNSLLNKKDKKRGNAPIPCSVHFTCDLDGKVRQHLPLDIKGIHAKGHNHISIGVEMITRYLPDYQSYSRPVNQPVVHSAHFHRGWTKRGEGIRVGDPGRFRLPSQEGMEGCYQLSKWLTTQIKTIPWNLLAEEEKGFAWIAANNISPKKFDHGVTSHSRSQANRADGVFTEHYIACRKNGCSPADAFNRTMAAAHMPKDPKGATYTNIHKPGVPYERYVPSENNKPWFPGKTKK